MQTKKCYWCKKVIIKNGLLGERLSSMSFIILKYFSVVNKPVFCDGEKGEKFIKFSLSMHSSTAITETESVFFEWDVSLRMFDRNSPENGKLICFVLSLSQQNESEQCEVLKCRHFAVIFTSEMFQFLCECALEACTFTLRLFAVSSFLPQFSWLVRLWMSWKAWKE